VALYGENRVLQPNPSMTVYFVCCVIIGNSNQVLNNYSSSSAKQIARKNIAFFFIILEYIIGNFLMHTFSKTNIVKIEFYRPIFS